MASPPKNRNQTNANTPQTTDPDPSTWNNENPYPVLGHVPPDLAGQMVQSGEYLAHTTVDQQGRLRTLIRHRTEHTLFEVRETWDPPGPWPDA